LLAGDELVRSPKEDFARQVPAKLAAEGASDGDRLEGELLPPRRNIAAAPLAGYDEGLATRRSREHENSIGEHKAKV